MAHRMQFFQIQNSTDQAETVYADIGPSSFAARPKISLGMEDDCVEYAQLNQNLLAVKPEQIQMASFVGW